MDQVPKFIEAIQNGRNNSWRNCQDNGAHCSKSESSVNEINVARIREELPPRIFLPSIPILNEDEANKKTHYAASSWKQFAILFKRNAVKLSRDKVS